MMKKQILLLAIVVMSCLGTRTASSQADCWDKRNSMSVAKAVMGANVVNGIIYAIGGSVDAYRSTTDVEAYDPAADRWTSKANLPREFCMATACTVNGKIYFIGGSTSILGSGNVTAGVLAYDPLSDSWTTKSSMPTPVGAAAAEVVNGKIYIFGGGPFGFNAPYNSVYEYDPATDTWKKKADMPTARFLASATALGGKIYVFGGATYLTGGSLSTVEVYDPSADAWAPRRSMPIARAAHASSAVNGRIYVFSGGAGAGSVYNDVQVYDPASDTWATRTSIPTPRFGLAACCVGGKVYTIGGIDAFNVRVSTVEEYDPALDIASAVESDQAGLPMKYSLHQNYPNPFNPSTMIRYDLPKTADVSLKIYNTLGQVIVTLVEELKDPGSYQVRWNANVPSGIYFCRLQVRQTDDGQDAEFVETKKMVLLH